jgi:hypothetical protein
MNWLHDELWACGTALNHNSLFQHLQAIARLQPRGAGSPSPSFHSPTSSSPSNSTVSKTPSTRSTIPFYLYAQTCLSDLVEKALQTCYASSALLIANYRCINVGIWHSYSRRFRCFLSKNLASSSPLPTCTHDCNRHHASQIRSEHGKQGIMPPNPRLDSNLMLGVSRV